MLFKKKDAKKTILREVGEIVFAFVVAWLGYQAIALATGTPLPIVAVVSDSMYHGPNDYRSDMCGITVTGPQDFNQFWEKCGNLYEQMGIEKEDFLSFPFRNGLSKGDLLLVVNTKPKVGDVVIYDSGRYTIVHRMVGETDATLVTKGDNNVRNDEPFQKESFRGKVVAAAPLLGYPRFLLFAFGI